MENTAEQLSKLGLHFSTRQHLHFYTSDLFSNYWPPVWWRYASDNSHWMTSWDDDAIALEMEVNFGKSGLQAYQRLEAQQRKQVAMALALSIEPGIAFTDGCDLLDETQVPQVQGDNVYYIYHEGSPVVCGHTSRLRREEDAEEAEEAEDEELRQQLRFRQLVMQLLQLLPEETPHLVPLQLQLCEVPWLVATASTAVTQAE